MRKILFPLFLLTVFAGFGESYDINLGGWVLDDYENIKKHEYIRIKTVDIDEHNDKYKIIMDNNDTLKLSGSIDKKVAFEINNIDDFWNSAIVSRVLPETVMKKGYQVDLRREMEDDALEYISKVKNMGLEFEDPYLETYIYGLITKIIPSRLIDGRVYNVNLLLLKDSEMNACMYPNGTMVINTGLLAMLKSEEELVSVLAHEVAHFVLDHSVVNVNKEITRKKRAAFWSGVVTGLTAIAEGVIAAKTDYIPGGATLAMGAASAMISSAVIDRLGMKYSHEQETEADEYSSMVLDLLGYPKNAGAAAMSRMKGQMDKEHRKCMYFSSYTHPALVDRIEHVGPVYEKSEPEFEKMVSFAISETAYGKFANRRFSQALDLLNINIKNNVATVRDYIVKSECYLSLYNDKSKLEKIFGFLEAAKKINPLILQIYKTEIIAHLRLGNKQQAIALLYEYNKLIKDVSEGHLDFKEKEDFWISNMLAKLGAPKNLPILKGAAAK